MRRMRRAFPLSVIALALFLSSCQDIVQAPDVSDGPLFSASAASASQEAERVMGGQVLVRLVDGASAQAVAASHGVQAGRNGPGGAYTVFRVTAGNERAAAARMDGDARVVWAEPNYLWQTTVINPKLWAFYNPGGLTISFTRGRNKGDVIDSETSVDDVDEDNVEDFGRGGVAVAVASIDTSVDFGHSEFLPDQLVAGWDFYSDDDDPSDENDHGTHTTGTMVGRTVGVAGVSGVGANVKVVVFRVCGSLGCPVSAIVDAIYAAADSGVVAMNLSLSGSTESESEEDAIVYALAAGSLVIASAGNGGTGTVRCPACDPNAISVAASNWRDELSYYSSWGPGLDIIAPGGKLYSNTTAEGGIWSSVRDGYAYFQGTSMAAPQVTGTAALVASMNSGLTASQIRGRIEGSVDLVGLPAGRLNSYRAVTNGDLGYEPLPPPPGNQAPIAAFDALCPDLTCNFTDSSSDTDGSVVGWSWDFGDLSGSGERNPSHEYSTANTYTVSLTVTDDLGAVSLIVTQEVEVTDPPPPPLPGAITLTAEGRKVRGRNVVDLSWSGGTAPFSVVRNSVTITSDLSGDTYTDDTGERGGVTYVYQVCDGGDCSNTATVVY